MEHRKAARLLYSLGDGLLGEGLEARVREHVGGCPDCTRAVREVELAEGLLRRVPQPLAPRHGDLFAEARLRAAARRGAPPRRPAGDRLALRALVASAMVGFVLIMVSVGPGRGVRPASSVASSQSWILPSAKRQLVAGGFEAPAAAYRAN